MAANTLLHLGGKASLEPPAVAPQPIVPRAPATLDAVILPCLHASVERRPDLALPRMVLRPNPEVITESEIEVCAHPESALSSPRAPCRLRAASALSRFPPERPARAPLRQAPLAADTRSPHALPTLSPTTR